MKRMTIVAVLLALIGIAPLAEATLILSSSVDGGPIIFAVDNSFLNTCGSPVVGPCQLPDTDPTLGSLALNSLLLAGGDLVVQSSLQTADVATGAGSVNRLDSTGTQVTNVGDISHSFVVAIGATDFLGPVTEATTTGAGQWSHLGDGFGDSEIAMFWWNDPANAQGALLPFGAQPGILIDSFSNTPLLNPTSFAVTGGPFAVNDPDLFSMTVQFEGTLAPGVRLTGRELTEIKPRAVSAPRALFLIGLGVGLMSLGRLGRVTTSKDV